MGPLALLGIGAALKGAGSLLGGRARKRAAYNADRRMGRIARKDQARAKALAREDEARLQKAHKEGIGYDLEKLRDEAVEAGFNPLSVLQTTGAANYATTPVPVLTTPFVPMGDYRQATTQGRVETAGYVGDAIYGAGNDVIGMGEMRFREVAMANDNVQRALDRAAFALPRGHATTASPVEDGITLGDMRISDPYFIGPVQPVNVRTNDGWFALDPYVAERLQISEGERMLGEDWERYYGEAGNFAAVWDILKGREDQSQHTSTRDAPKPSWFGGVENILRSVQPTLPKFGNPFFDIPNADRFDDYVPGP